MNNFINEKLLSIIGFDYIVGELNIQSSYGKNYFKKLLPFSTKEELEKEYSYIELYMGYLDELIELDDLFMHLKDINSSLKKCENGYVLDIVDLYEIKVQALIIDKISKITNPLKLDSFVLEDCQEVLSLLSDNDNYTPDFYLYNAYSDNLSRIRKRKREIERQIRDNPIEKEQLLELRHELVIAEQEEELKVRTDLSKKLRPLMKIIRSNIHKLSHMDVLIAKARLAKKYHLVKPIITDKNLVLSNMEHPLISKNVCEQGNRYTKNTISMSCGTTIITGANMGGKSSIIKTIAFNVYLAHLGFYVFADYCEFPLLNGILYLGLDTDNNAHGLSTFGQEIVLLNEIVRKMKKGSYLICIDEFARSTNPYEGQKFVKALAKFANNYSSYTLIATHYDNIADNTMAHYQITGLKEVKIDESKSFLYNINQLMDYTLIKVNSESDVPKEAYKVAKILQIDDDFQKFLDVSYKE
ncbi:MAG TPA: DNA mismatch repair protein MutS [Haloplasmataceae bacterium]